MPRNDAGLREAGRSLCPAKGLEALLAEVAKGATKLVEREALRAAGEEAEEEEELRALMGGRILEEDGKGSVGLLREKVEAAVAAISIASKSCNLEVSLWLCG